MKKTLFPIFFIKKQIKKKFGNKTEIIKAQKRTNIPFITIVKKSSNNKYEIDCTE